MLLDDLFRSLRDFAIQYGYVGILLVSLLGAMSIFVPIPSTVVIFILGGVRNSSGTFLFEPLLIAVFAGIGATVGEFSGYVIGYGGRRVIGEKYKHKMDILMRLFKRFGPIVIFLFALTPLPDDLIFIPLGVMKYSMLSAFIPALVGKFLSNLIIAYAGRFSLQFLGDLFGVEGEASSFLIGTALAIILLVVVLVIMFKVNWEKYAEKYLNETEKKNGKTQPDETDDETLEK